MLEARGPFSIIWIRLVYAGLSLLGENGKWPYNFGAEDPGKRRKFYCKHHSIK
jgi:hypothetical protein